MSKELPALSKSTIGTSSSSNMCPRHPGYELTYFNAKEGRKQCLMCIMRASVAEGGREKERFCVKHPGYENAFYCSTDQKVCCEKCLVYHKKHKVESIALKAENLREKFDEYKTDFVGTSKQWAGFYNSVKGRKESIESEVDKTSKTIETIFDTIIEKLKKRKVDSVNSFKKKAWTMLQEFNEKFRECENDVKDINRRTEEFGELGQLFTSGDNMELITKSMELGIEDLMDNYCPFLKQKLDQYKDVFNDLKAKTNYSFAVANNFNEQEVNEFINKQFVVKIAKSERQEDIESHIQPLSPEPVESFPHESQDKGEEIILHKFDPTNKMIWLYQGQEFMGSPLPIMKSPAKVKGKGGIENWSDLKSYRSQMGEIYAFEGTDKGTSTIYKYIPESMTFEVAFNLPFTYRKITIADNKEMVYIGGESCEISEETRPPQILAYNIANGEIEAVSSGLPKISGFALTMVKGMYLYVIPLALHNEKIYKTDITSPKPAESTEEQKSGIKEQVYNWEPVVVKNPKNFNIQLFAPVWALEVYEDSIMILTGKGSLLFNWKEEQIVEYAVLRQKDEFTDGAYKVEGQVWAYGKQGVHTYSTVSRKWNFIPQVSKPL